MIGRVHVGTRGVGEDTGRQLHVAAVASLLLSDSFWEMKESINSESFSELNQYTDIV